MTEKNIKILKSGGVGVIPTDTLYGLVACAQNRKAVEKVYVLKKRDPKKPCIILINSIEDVGLFGVTLTRELLKTLYKFWPGKVSIELLCSDDRFEYLHRGKKSLAFRLPNKKDLLDMLAKTGPLVAPSANKEGEYPAQNIFQAKKYFGDNVDFYEDGGLLKSLPSTLIKIEKGKVKILHKGVVKVK